MARNAFKKDYYGGALMILIGLTAVYASIQYHLGSLRRMGPGFFPCAIGALLALCGLLIALSARGPAAPRSGPVVAHHSTGLPDLRGGVCILLGTLAFIAFGRYLGLLPATFAIVFICALGDRSNSLRQAVVLSIAMTIIAAVVFWWALGLQLPLFKWGN